MEGLTDHQCKVLKLLSDTKIVRHTKLKIGMNPYLDNDYFVLRKSKQRFKKLRAMAKSVGNKSRKTCQHATETMINNCCPTRVMEGLSGVQCCDKKVIS